jgi:DNA (cytosine-5)-methyltransferase 1
LGNLKPEPPFYARSLYDPRRPLQDRCNMIYYNEWDAKKAAWLEQLQKDGLLASGTTDTTDINDVLPANLSDFDRVHLFAGIGGWEYACELAGWAGPIWTASCPCQPFSAAGRRGGTADERHLFPAVHWLVQQCRPPIIVGEQVASKDGLAWLDTVFARLEATGYTCAAYDLSAASVGAPHIRQRLYWVAYTHEASQRAGSRSVRHERDDASGGGSIERLANSQEERHEQPWNARERGAGLADNGGLGYAEPGRLYREPRRGAGLADNGGLGYSDEERPCQQESIRGLEGLRYCEPSEHGAQWSNVEWVLCIDPRDQREIYRPVETGLTPLAHGVPARMVRISGYGDAIVPQLAAIFLRAVKEELNEK